MQVPTHVQAALSGVAAVIHSAGLLQGASTDIELMKAIEIDGTRNLLEACLDKDIKAFIYTSSGMYKTTSHMCTGLLKMQSGTSCTFTTCSAQQTCK